MCLEIRDAMQIIKTILFRSETKSYKKEATMKLTSPSKLAKKSSIMNVVFVHTHYYCL